MMVMFIFFIFDKRRIHVEMNLKRLAPRGFNYSNFNLIYANVFGNEKN